MADPFQSLPDEDLLNIFYQADPKDLSALCSSSPLLNRICGEPEVRKKLLRGKYLRILDMGYLERLFLDLVADAVRNPGNTYMPSTYISHRDLEHLTAVVESHPELVKVKVRPEKRRGTVTELLLLTRNPQVMDLLLRYGAEIDDVVFRQRISEALYSPNNNVVLSQLVGYRGGFPYALNTNIKDSSLPFFYHLVRIGMLDIRSVILHNTLIFPYSYFLVLDALNSGIKTTDDLIPTSGGSIDSSIHTSPSLSLHALQYCYDNRDAAQITMYGQPSNSIDFYYSLTDITMEPPPMSAQTYLKLSYQQLKQLQNVGRNPFWNDEAFWSAKLEQDFPNEQGIGSTNRLRYLYLFTTPNLEFRTPGGTRSLSLDFPTGKGLLTCRHLLGLKEQLPITSLRLLGYFQLQTGDVASGLYHVTFLILNTPIQSMMIISI